jgi:hypothetical protein
MGPEATEIKGDDVGRCQETRSGCIVMQDGEKKRRTPSESRRTKAAEAERRARLLKRKTRHLICDAFFQGLPCHASFIHGIGRESASSGALRKTWRDYVLLQW